MLNLHLHPTPRGIRNNNPGNIRLNPRINWVGEVKGRDPSFCYFHTMDYGVRAAGKIFLTYQREDKLMSINAMINRWAPPSENNTSAYVLAVEKACNDPFGAYELDSAAKLSAFLRAVFIHENGGNYVTAGALNNGCKLALG